MPQKGKRLLKMEETIHEIINLLGMPTFSGPRIHISIKFSMPAKLYAGTRLQDLEDPHIYFNFFRQYKCHKFYPKYF